MIQNLKENWLVAWKMTYIIWLIFMQAVKGLKIWNLIGFFVQSIWNFWWKSTEELCFMTLKSDAKFEEKLILGSKNDMRNLVSFNASSGKSENLHFDVLLLSIAYKVSAEKVQKNYLSWRWKKIQTLKKNWLFVWKMTWGIWWTLTQSVECLKTWRVIVSWKMIYGFKNDTNNWANFHTSSWN